MLCSKCHAVFAFQCKNTRPCDGRRVLRELWASPVGHVLAQIPVVVFTAAAAYQFVTSGSMWEEVKAAVIDIEVKLYLRVEGQLLLSWLRACRQTAMADDFRPVHRKWAARAAYASALVCCRIKLFCFEKISHLSFRILFSSDFI